VGRSYVTQPNGKVESVQRRRFLPDGIPTPRAGSTVVVPAGAGGIGVLAAASQTSAILSGLIPAITALLALLAVRR
jgi:hypothetical protein